ncbi:MAG: YbaN family protein [Pirellulaceae bacterium]|nr:YbaN family protein [Pirellulaceae bacterium]
MMTMSKVGPSEPARQIVEETTRPRRFLLALLGLMFAGIGIVGILLPGIPTTVPLLVASWLLAKSNPAWERRLLGLPLVRRYLSDWQGSTRMPPRARIWATLGMWTSIALSYFAWSDAELTPSRLGLGLVVLGLVGTVAIWSFQSSIWQALTMPRPRSSPAWQASAATGRASGSL